MYNPDFGNRQQWADWKASQSPRAEKNPYHVADEGELQHKLKILSENMAKFRREANRGNEDAQQVVEEAEKRRAQIIEALEKKRRVA